MDTAMTLGDQFALVFLLGVLLVVFYKTLRSVFGSYEDKK